MRKKAIGNKSYSQINIQSAAKLFKKYGFADVSVDSIVEKAGVSKGTFYVHFDSKDALIVALTADYVNELDFDYKSFLDSFSADKSLRHSYFTNPKNFRNNC